MPLAAVTAEGSVPYVWTVDPATAQVKKTIVQLGPYGETRVPVLDGIGPQDWARRGRRAFAARWAEGEAGRSRQPRRFAGRELTP